MGEQKGFIYICYLIKIINLNSFDYYCFSSYKTLQVDANDALRAGDFTKAISICLQCQRKILKSLGSQSPELIYVNLMLCEAYTFECRYSEAFSAIKTAGKLLDACPGITDGHMYRVYYYRDLGNLFRIQGRLDESIACLQRV